MSHQDHGFTLLEVLVALAILGLGLTTILSAQAGLFSSSNRSAHITEAGNLARCRLNEIEAELMRVGLPITDQQDEGRCCEGEDTDDFTCSWLIETVVLPEMGDLGDGGLDQLDQPESGKGDQGAPVSAPKSGLFGGPGGLRFDAGLGPMNTQNSGSTGLFGGLVPGGGLEGESGSGAPDIGGMVSMAISMVYPDLKPMLEASIRRVTVKVEWKEGSAQRDFSLAEYLTKPQEGGLLPGMPGYDPTASDGGVPDLSGIGQLLGAGNTPTGTRTGL